MTDVATSESADSSSSSSSVNWTTTETNTTTKHMLPTILITMRVSIILILAVFNLGGNGFTLITIRLTPRLWTKTNFVLASMLVADLIIGVTAFVYASFILVVFVFSNPCHYIVPIAALTTLLRIPSSVGVYHLVLISVERYIAIVYPLHYENMFTDRKLKWAIFAVWATGICIPAINSLWLINADLGTCDLSSLPVPFHLVDLLVIYAPICISLFTSYGKILAVSSRHRQRIRPEPANANSTSAAVQFTATTTTTPPVTQSGKATSSDDTVHPKNKPPTSTGPPSESAVTSRGASAELTQEQLRKIKSWRREFKAVYLTAAIVGTFVVLWFPYALGCILLWAGYDPVVVNYLQLASGPIGSANFAFSWVIYAAVSKSYRRAYRQMLIRIGCCCCKDITLQAGHSVVV